MSIRMTFFWVSPVFFKLDFHSLLSPNMLIAIFSLVFMDTFDTTGIVFDIAHSSYVDGPGLRTTVFFKGCNLRCDWCHNPESQSCRPCKMFYADKCIGCPSKSALRKSKCRLRAACACITMRKRGKRLLLIYTQQPHHLFYYIHHL